MSQTCDSVQHLDRFPALASTGQSREEYFRIEQRGAAAIMTPAAGLEGMEWESIESAAEMVLPPLRRNSLPLLVVNLSNVTFFGSVFLSLLLRTWELVTARGGTMLISGASPNCRELLRLTALDTLWAIYDTTEEALAVLHSE